MTDSNPFADLVPDSNQFSDLAPAAGDNPFLDLVPGRADSALVGTAKSFGQGVVAIPGMAGAMLQKRGYGALVGPPKASPQEYLDSISLQRREKLHQEQMYGHTDNGTGVLPEFIPSDQDKMDALAWADKENSTRQLDWQTRLSAETPEAAESRKQWGAALVKAGGNVRNWSNRVQQDIPPVEAVSRQNLLDVVQSGDFGLGDKARAVTYAVARNAPNFVVSFITSRFGGSLMGRAGVAGGALSSSYMLEGGDIWDEGAQFLEEKYKGADKVPDEEWAKLIELTDKHALFNAALDAVAPADMAGATLRKTAKELGIRKVLSGDGLKYVTKSGARTAAEEIPTEVAQEESSVEAVEGVGKQVSPHDRLARYFEAGIAAGLTGHAAGTTRAAAEIIGANRGGVDRARTEKAPADSAPDNAEDILGGVEGSASENPFQDLLALPAPKMVATSQGEVGTEAQFEARRRQDESADRLGMQEVASAVHGRATPEAEVKAPELPPLPPDLLKTVASAGGMNMSESESQGIDKAAFADHRQAGGFGKPLFRRTGGMTMDGLAEFLSQRGFLPEGQYYANDALDLLTRALSGEKIYSQADLKDVAERNALEHDYEQQLKDREKSTPEQMLQNAKELRQRIEDFNRRRVRDTLGAEAVWQPTPSDLELSGYNKASPDVQDLTAVMHEGRRIMGDDAFEALYERLSLQHPDLDGAAFEGVLTDAIRREENAQKPGVPEEARRGAEHIAPPVQAGAGAGQKNARQATAEPRQARQEVAAPSSVPVQQDMLGGKSATAQAAKDAEVERQKKIDAAPPVESGPGDLFSGKSRQTDIADLKPSGKYDVPRGTIVKVKAVDKSGKTVTVTEDAAAALERTDEQLTLARRLLECLSL